MSYEVILYNEYHLKDDDFKLSIIKHNTLFDTFENFGELINGRLKINMGKIIDKFGDKLKYDDYNLCFCLYIDYQNMYIYLPNVKEFNIDNLKIFFGDINFEIYCDDKFFIMEEYLIKKIIE